MCLDRHHTAQVAACGTQRGTAFPFRRLHRCPRVSSAEWTWRQRVASVSGPCGPCLALVGRCGRAQHVGGSRPQPRASLRAWAPGVLHAWWPLSGEARTCLVRVIVGVSSHVTLSSGCWLCVYRGARARRWEEVALQAWKVTPPVASPPSRAGLPSCGFAESLASQRLGFPAHELVSPVTTGVLPAPFRCGCLFRLAAWLPGESRIPVSFPIWGKLSGFPGSVMFAMGVSRCLLSH